MAETQTQSFAIFVTDGPSWVPRGEVRPWYRDWRYATREDAERALGQAWKIPGVAFEVREVRS